MKKIFVENECLWMELNERVLYFMSWKKSWKRDICPMKWMKWKTKKMGSYSISRIVRLVTLRMPCFERTNRIANKNMTWKYEYCRMWRKNVEIEHFYEISKGNPHMGYRENPNKQKLNIQWKISKAATIKYIKYHAKMKFHLLVEHEKWREPKK